MVSAADLLTAATALNSDRQTVDTVLTNTTGLGTQVADLADDSVWWEGPQGDDLRLHLADTSSVALRAWQPLTDMASEMTRLQTTAQTLAERLGPLERERSDIWAPSILVDGPLSVLDVTGHFDQQAARRDEIDALVAGIQLEWDLACRGAEGVLMGAAGTVSTLVPADEQLMLGGLVLPTGIVLATLIATGKGSVPATVDPAAVAAWWESLSAEEQREWFQLAPHLLGNTDGIPFEIRYDANRRVMQDLLDNLPSDDPRRQNLSAFLIDGELDPTLQIVFFDFAGDGRVAQVFGDLADADHVAVLVPGMGSTMSNFRLVQQDAKSLFHQTGGAVIAWSGYDAPAGIETGLDNPGGLLEVTRDDQAREGGRYLASLIGAVHLESSSPTTLIGHSYGSLTTGQALLQGAQVDNVVFIGSPGVGVDNVDEFPPGAADRYYAGEIDGDPVAALERFGDAPTDPDFGAAVIDSGADDSLNPFARHSSYYNQGIGLDNLAAVVQGDQPTTTRPTLLEHALEFGEDAGESTNEAIDSAQRVIDTVQRIATPLNPLGPVNPFNSVDNHLVDGVQTAANTVGAAASPLIETGGNLAGTVVDRTVDAVDTVVDRGIEVGREAVDTAVDTGRDIAEGAIDGGKTVIDTVTFWD